ncbi:glycerophosphoryl diester phosphodiesterase [Alishewanella longhuensis]
MHCDAGFIDEKMVKDAKARGLKVYVYTVDSKDELAQMQQLGVDGIFTNYPAQSRQFLGL